MFELFVVCETANDSQKAVLKTTKQQTANRLLGALP
jgi:hypothetical protein